MNMQVFWPAMQQARWYSGKSRAGHPVEHRTLGWYTPAGAEPRVRSELIRVAYPDQTFEWYHLPVSYSTSPGSGLYGETPDGYAHDATAVPEAMAAVLNALRVSQTTETYSCHDTGASELPAGLSARRHGGEQSNTSVFFGSAAMLKFFRRLEPGRNLDIELHAALADSGAVARLFGWIETPRFDLGMLVEALPEPVDGYELACERVGADFEADASALGAALARVHQGLRATFGLGKVSGEQLATDLLRRAEDVASDAAPLPALLPAIAARYASLRPLDIETQRVHGDFHLGQTLRTPGGWRIVDFEGEPLKTMDERRAFDSPWRDVAGMLRSIDYAAATKGSAATNWRSAAREAFLASYCGAMRTTPSPALAAYELDKALYEVRYEVRNRPHLIHVPLDFITATLKEN